MLFCITKNKVFIIMHFTLKVLNITYYKRHLNGNQLHFVKVSIDTFKYSHDCNINCYLHVRICTNKKFDLLIGSLK